MLANRIWQAIKNILYDRTNPITVASGSSLTTSASARPQRLSNGWLVAAALDSSTVRVYVSKNGGGTWEQLCYISAFSGSGFSMASYNTRITIVNQLTATYSVTFDATTVTNIDLNSTKVLIRTGADVSGTTTGSTIAVNQTNGHMTAAFVLKVTAYPNSYNIFSAKSVDGGVTWTKQDGTSGVDQVTSINSSTAGVEQPSVVYKNDIPHIIAYGYSTGIPAYCIYDFTTAFTSRVTSPLNIPTGTGWGYSLVHNGGSYTQSSPSATIISASISALINPAYTNGLILVTWVGVDGTHNQFNVRFSISADNGVTWLKLNGTTGHDKLTTYASSYAQQNPSIAVNDLGQINIYWEGNDSSNPTYWQLKRILSNGTTWGIQENITTGGTISRRYASLCDNYFKFEHPIMVYQDTSLGVRFMGKWYE